MNCHVGLHFQEQGNRTDIFNQSCLFPRQNVSKVISSIDEADISNLNKKNILAMHYDLQGS